MIYKHTDIAVDIILFCEKVLRKFTTLYCYWCVRERLKTRTKDWLNMLHYMVIEWTLDWYIFFKVRGSTSELTAVLGSWKFSKIYSTSQVDQVPWKCFSTYVWLASVSRASAKPFKSEHAASSERSQDFTKSKNWHNWRSNVLYMSEKDFEQRFCIFFKQDSCSYLLHEFCLRMAINTSPKISFFDGLLVKLCLYLKWTFNPKK